VPQPVAITPLPCTAVLSVSHHARLCIVAVPFKLSRFTLCFNLCPCHARCCSIQPSICVPWVKHSVTREMLQEAFGTLGKIRQIDLVSKGDHLLCFVHFLAWDVTSASSNAVRNRLLNPPHADHKESLQYNHPSLGKQRLLYARSRMSVAGAILSGSQKQ
jgi:hypothetical protein